MTGDGEKNVKSRRFYFVVAGESGLRSLSDSVIANLILDFSRTSISHSVIITKQYAADFRKEKYFPSFIKYLWYNFKKKNAI